MANYILSFDPTNPSISASQLAVFIRLSREIEGWYSPFLGTYMLKSNENLLALLKSFGEIFGNASFILVAANSAQVTGSLPSSVWAWFSEGNAGTLAALASYGVVPPPPRR